MLLCSPDAWAKSMLVTRHPKLYFVLYSLFHLPVPVSKYVLFYRAMNWGKTFFSSCYYYFSFNNLFSFDFSHFLTIFFVFLQHFLYCGAFFSLPVFIHFKTLQFFFSFTLLVVFSFCID